MTDRPLVLLWKNKVWEASGSNLGDLAIIGATVDALRAEIPGVRVLLLSDDPEHTRSLYDVESRPFSAGAYFRAIREADLVVLGGGTLFTDATAAAVPVNTSAAYLGKLLGTPVVGYGVATGKMNAVSRRLVRGALRRMGFACVRDRESRDECLRLVPSLGERVRVTEDVAFSLRVPEPRPERANRVVIAPRRIFHYGNTLLPFAVRRRLKLLPKGYFEKMEEFKDLLARVADHVVETHGADVSFLPMYSAIGSSEGTTGYLKTRFSSRDDVVCADIRERMRHKGRAEVFLSDRPREALSLLAGSRLLVGVPLHSLILSHVAETPFVGLSYQGKVERFMRRSGMERFMIHVESMGCPLDRDEFLTKVDACLAEEDVVRETLRAGNVAMRGTVDLPARMTAELLGAKG